MRGASGRHWALSDLRVPRPVGLSTIWLTSSFPALLARALRRKRFQRHDAQAGEKAREQRRERGLERERERSEHRDAERARKQRREHGSGPRRRAAGRAPEEGPARIRQRRNDQAEHADRECRQRRGTGRPREAGRDQPDGGKPDPDPSQDQPVAHTGTVDVRALSCSVTNVLGESQTKACPRLARLARQCRDQNPSSLLVARRSSFLPCKREAAPRGAGPPRTSCRRRYGVAIFQRPRPWVAAMMYEPFGLSCRSFTDACGRVPRRDQVVAAPWPAVATKTPMSLASTSLPRVVRTRSSPGASGRLPLMSVQLTPPSVVSQTWPSPAENVFVHRREKPLKTTYACDGFAGSTVIAWMKRFGNDAGRVSACQEPP